MRVDADVDVDGCFCVHTRVRTYRCNNIPLPHLLEGNAACGPLKCHATIHLHRGVRTVQIHLARGLFDFLTVLCAHYLRAKMAQQCALTPFPLSGVVKLNAGGTIFVASVRTLAESPYFATMIGNPTFSATYLPASDSFFIDRDGTLFSYILDYLRTHTVPCDLSAGSEIERRLIQEAEFYSLEDMVQQLSQSVVSVRRKVVSGNSTLSYMLN